ncbi:MAG: hypothetical protein CUN56_13080, partial [Phototrophicales bacterium]
MLSNSVASPKSRHTHKPPLSLKKSEFNLVYIGLMIIMILAACGTGTAQTTPTDSPIVIIKRLATVAPTNTPSEAEMQMTQQAVARVPTYTAPTITPTPTPYIGVFIGEVQDPLANEILDPRDFVIEPTPLPAVRLVCGIEVAPVFGDDWRQVSAAVNAMRCPIQESFGFRGRIQVFERGVMYHRIETNEIWAISQEDYWYITDPALEFSAAGVNVPAGFFPPEEVFAAVWATFPEIQEAVGYGLQPAADIDVN